MIAVPTGVKKALDVSACRACGGEHLALEFTEFNINAPTGPALDLLARCPLTKRLVWLEPLDGKARTS